MIPLSGTDLFFALKILKHYPLHRLGGNIDTSVLGRCLERGLAADGRLCRFRVIISDRPGGMAELTKLIGQMDVSLKDIFHDRAWLKFDVFR